MQRRSPRGQTSTDVPLMPDIKVEQEEKVFIPRRRGRPRRSLVEVLDTCITETEPSTVTPEKGSVILNARGMPARQRKRNRYYAFEEVEVEEKEKDEKTQSVKPKLVEKKIKLEPLQILLDNPSTSLKVTPIISEVEGEVEVVAPVQAKKSVIKLVMPPKEKDIKEAMKTEEFPLPVTQTIIPKTVLGRFGYSQEVVTKLDRQEVATKVDRQEFITRVDRPPELPKLDIYRRADYSSFIRFFANVKTKVIMPDRWGINGVMFDPMKKLKAFSISEMEISPTGELRLRKCLQVFEDLSIKVLIQGQELTEKIEGMKKIQSESDVPALVSKISLLKVCSGVKNFSPHDLNFHPTAQKKGICYFAAECQTILAFNYVGALCPPCNKLRNAVRRRNVKTKQEQEKCYTSANVNQMPSTFGQTLYSFLHLLSSEEATPENVKPGKPLQEIKIEPGTVRVNGNERRRSVNQKLPRKTKTEPKPRKRKDSGNLHGPVTISHVIDPVTGMAQAVVPHEYVDYMTLGGEPGNVFIQNGGEFNFDDGQEYELLGETDPLQSLHLGSQEQTIQIIELDDQTMAHFAGNINMSGMFFPSNIQVTEIDPNDPNTMFKVINPEEFVLPDTKL